MPPRHHGPTQRLRFFIFFTVLIFVPLTTYLVIQLARGYRPDLENKTLRPTGLLVARSVPPDAEVFINGERLGITETTINLNPGTYEVNISKEGFSPWAKTLLVEKELVTSADALLFPSHPIPTEIRPVSTESATISPDSTKLIFVSPSTMAQPTQTPTPTGTQTKPTPTPAQSPTAIFSLELSDSPLNLNREPRQITPNTPVIRWENAVLDWSPDSRQILVRLPRDLRCKDFDRPKNPCSVSAAYLLDPTRSNNLTNIVSTHRNLLQEWSNEQEIRDSIIITKIPKILAPALLPAVTDIRLSPDDSKILYTATSSATIPDMIIPPVPAANTQPQERTIRPGFMYIYDIEEDRNFLLGKASHSNPTPSVSSQQSGNTNNESIYTWFPSSRHLLSLANNEIKVVEYDGTNLTPIYASPAIVSAFPSSSGHRLFIVTNDNDPLKPSLLSFINFRP